MRDKHIARTFMAIWTVLNEITCRRDLSSQVVNDAMNEIKQTIQGEGEWTGDDD